MRFTSLALAASAATAVSAQRPANTPICDYYTTALLKDNTAENQMALLTVLVNTVVIGNYTMPNVGIAVPGILAPGEVDGTQVNLAPYFTGALASSNRGGKTGVSVNFLDGGGAAPLKKNKAADDDSSNQYMLLTHLYEFFGSLLGCSKQGMSGFDAYSGDASMYEVHKFMDLNLAEVTYFITQVGTAAASFGVAKDDIAAVAKALNGLFNVQCGPKTAVIKAQGPQLQSICVDAKTCPKAANPDCGAYAAAVEPSSVPASMMPTATSGSNSTGSASTMTGSMMPTGTMPAGGASTVPTGAASANGLSLAAVVAGIAAFAL